jgi:hypothetical protein
MQTDRLVAVIENTMVGLPRDRRADFLGSMRTLLSCCHIDPSVIDEAMRRVSRDASAGCVGCGDDA